MENHSSSLMRIRILPPGVAERIAAGEVIERPASVVKELVENSIDAGAKDISVLLEEGGKSLIEVLDNGHGMLPEDLLLCTERHATSKLSSLEDLEKIHTLGFRGEALPSIGAVSDLNILSRARGHETAYELSLTSLGQPKAPEPKTFGHFLNTSHGTRIQARGLFSQVPARLKFLKSQSAEVSQVREWLERLALAHANIGFRLMSDGRSILSLRAQEETSRVRALLSDRQADREVDDPGFPILTGSNDLGFRDRTDGSLHIRVHWLQGLSSPQARRLIQVVNGRAVRDRMLQQALLAPFRQVLLPGQFPAVALYIEVDPAEIDVNVHPTKTEIRFLDSRTVFREVEKVVQTLIAREGAPAYAGSTRVETSPELSSWRAAQPDFKPMAFELSSTEKQNWTSSVAPMRHASSSSTSSMGALSRFENLSPPSPSFPKALTETSAAHPLAELLRPERYLGIIFQTYLFYDLGHELGLIDQHAAHERIRYERLKKSVISQETPPAQALLIPEAVRFLSEYRIQIEARLAWLIRLGFEVEVFGEDTLLFRAIPSHWGTEELRPRLKNLVDRLLELELPEMDAYPKASRSEAHTASRAALGTALGGAESGSTSDSISSSASGSLSSSASGISMDEILFERLASEACHSAVRAGDRLEREEALALTQQLFLCEHPWNCPHGRPTVVRVPKARVEEWFQRRV